MHSSTFLSLAAALIAPVLASPTPVDLSERAVASQCGQWDSIQTNGYTLYADLWNEAAGTGSQCSSATGSSGNAISWATSWSWSGGSNQVKSYTNAVLNMPVISKLSAISSIPTTWAWSYTGSNIVADVSYDMFLSSTPTGSNEFEIMVWLGALGGAGPISSTGSPIATPTIGGTTFNLFKGPNGQTTVYSFVVASKMDTNFSGDLKAFFTYLIANQGLSANEYLLSIGAGTEPFTGSNAVLTVSSYSAAVVLGSAPAPVSSTKAATTVVATSAKATSTKASSTTTAIKATGSALPKYSQCGGQGYTGSTVCAAGSTCTASSIYYSQCL